MWGLNNVFDSKNFQSYCHWDKSVGLLCKTKCGRSAGVRKEKFKKVWFHKLVSFVTILFSVFSFVCASSEFENQFPGVNSEVYIKESVTPNLQVGFGFESFPIDYVFWFALV